MQYYKPSNPDTTSAPPNTKVSKTACLSLALVFSDILPSHRVSSNPNSSERVSKDVRRQRLYDSRLLQAYTSYVKRLSSDEAPHANKALCRLMRSAQGFNLSTAVTREVAGRAFRPRADQALARSLGEMFGEDKGFDATLVALGHIKGAFLKLLKKKSSSPSRGPTLTPSQVGCLQSLLLIKPRALTSDVAAARILQQNASRARKRSSALQSLEDAEANEGAQGGGAGKLALNQGRVVEDLCAVYFQGLKHGVVTGDEGLVNVVVRGLTVHGSRVNVDVVAKLMKVFKALLVGEEGAENPHRVGTLSALSCVECCYALLSHSVEETGDGSWLTVALYRALGRLDCGSASAVRLALRCVDLCVFRRREVRKAHVHALAKRLLTAAAGSGRESGARALVSLARVVMARYESARRGVEKEEPVGEPYEAGADDPDFANPFGEGGGYWELAALRFSYSPGVREAAAEAAKGGRVDGQPLKVFEEVRGWEDDVRFELREPKRHPLMRGQVGAGNREGGDRKRRRTLGRERYVKGRGLKEIKFQLV